MANLSDELSSGKAIESYKMKAGIIGGVVSPKVI